MLGRHSIRFRLTLWYTLVLSAILAAFGGLTWFSLRHRLLDELDQELEGRASRFEAFFRAEAATDTGGQLRDELEEFSQALPPSHTIRLRGPNGFSFDYPASTAGASGGEVRTVSRQFAFRNGQYELEVTTPIGDVQHTLDLLRLLLLSLLPATIVLACGAGAFLSGRALKPVHEITASARSISIENLSARLPALSTEDELSRLTDVLNSMFGRLDDAVRTLSQFVGDASHELRTPLAVIRTTAELALRRDRDPESYRQSLRQVLTEVDHMTMLVEELLELARNDAGNPQVVSTPVDLHRLLGEACAEIAGISRGRDIRLVEPNGPVLILGSEPSLRRLFLALLDNAVKYSPVGGEVRVSIERSDDSLTVVVRDSGEGIAAVDLPYIFKRFYRADPARHGEGHGLGLALADSIARAHHARIEVESTQGSGSAFRVIFPILASLRQTPLDRVALLDQ